MIPWNVQISIFHIDRKTSVTGGEGTLLRHGDPTAGISHLADNVSRGLCRGGVTVLCGCLVCPEEFQECVSHLVSLPQQTLLCLLHPPLSCPSMNHPPPKPQRSNYLGLFKAEKREGAKGVKQKRKLVEFQKGTTSASHEKAEKLKATQSLFRQHGAPSTSLS